MEDTTDVNWLSFLRGSGSSSDNTNEVVIPSRIPTCYQLADFYNTNHKRRGIALIFNHEYFDDPKIKPRNGTNIDRDNLEEVLTKLDFDVRVYNNLKFGKLSQVIKSVSQEDHSDYDCFLVCVMSHGNDDRIDARDNDYPVDLLWMPFTGDKCITLAGKPKLFFIQACRGANVDDGALVRNKIQTDSCGNNEITYRIPAMADILVMYSTYSGYYSWRSPDKGSWFIQALCHELKKRANQFDLMTILTFVNRRIALFHQSNVPKEESMHEKKQICTIVSMLTRLVIFPSKQNITNYDGQEEQKNIGAK